MIVDDADVEIEMSEDPFKEAGIYAPPNLPYQDKGQVMSESSVTRCGKIGPLWHNLKTVLPKSFQGLFSIWQYFEPTI